MSGKYVAAVAVTRKFAGAIAYFIRCLLSAAHASSQSAATIGRSPRVDGASGSPYSLTVRVIVIRGARREKPTSISFFGFSERCQ